MFNSGWEKFEKYYRLSDDSPAYAAALVLHPRLKWQYIDKHWDNALREGVRGLVLNLWEEYRPTNSAVVCTNNSSIIADDDNLFSLFFRNTLSEIDVQSAGDEYEHYCTSPCVPTCADPLEWWLEPTQQKQYPNLARMALDILSIPAMSAGPERLFSGAKITITDRRNRLGMSSINALMCLKSWFGLLDMEEAVIKVEKKIKVLEDEAIRKEVDTLVASSVDELEID